MSGRFSSAHRQATQRGLTARVRRALAGAAFGCAVLGSTTWASAYCRTTTCDASVSCSTKPQDCCIVDADGCDRNGIPIAWATSCVSYNTHKGGSPLRDISKEQLRDTLSRAYDAWLSVECSGQNLSIALEDRGYASCGVPEFNEDDKDTNANVWMFREDSASNDSSSEDGTQIDASALAVAVVSFDFTTGEIVDVDVELNSPVARFTLSDDAAQTDIDLQSVVTHEAGHFLGLDHSLERGATMLPGYLPGHLEPRTLSDDDMAGICAIYPAERIISASNQTCEPHGSYSPACNKDGCGCSVVGSDTPSSSRAAWLLLAGALLAMRRQLRAGARRLALASTSGS